VRRSRTFGPAEPARVPACRRRFCSRRTHDVLERRLERVSMVRDGHLHAGVRATVRVSRGHPPTALRRWGTRRGRVRATSLRAARAQPDPVLSLRARAARPWRTALPLRRRHHPGSPSWRGGSPGPSDGSRRAARGGMRRRGHVLADIGHQRRRHVGALHERDRVLYRGAHRRQAPNIVDRSTTRWPPAPGSTRRQSGPADEAHGPLDSAIRCRHGHCCQLIRRTAYI
jgi:hypothetical protein